MAFPRGRRGANQELIAAHAKELLRSLIESRSTSTRLALIQQELLQSYQRGVINGHRWRARPGEDVVTTQP
jgi:hypothetical protein